MLTRALAFGNSGQVQTEGQVRHNGFGRQLILTMRALSLH
jgi:hypothetical protein